jgi:hypothetical protein
MPYSEFLWADFLRRRVDLHIVVKDFEAAVAEAITHAHHPDARYLPGWCGAVE